ncbi:NAD(P)/FAD-dependent oxidoreductase [Clostridium botulinum]|nr:FAD-dependent oxidoreductase [Clostridium botulinum]AEB76893.1 sarcosine oxidase alpha subunit [Clostridium botulinum BKT015925]KEH97360.1 oxidoreductase [Clostridium botulinum D str. 16868]KEH99517.1 oxidoreductase [Clostridium botulinum C/D str. Sp77]MCD3198935.1 FAD-dependent oxidoreductase [Clostridium botulinum C/D]MCD3204370.1 FAD-dependent oxidoreductase [Clostridium botulinum C/D]
MEDVTMLEYDIVIIGGGAAGLAAAISAKKSGIDKILILERESCLGGTLNQCIHNGFGVEVFNENLTGPEYVEKFIEAIHEMDIEYKLDTCVVEFNSDKVIKAVSRSGIIEIKSKAIIISTGCREKPRGLINIAGRKSAGIFTAGSAQKFVNLEGYMPGKEIVILGSGNIALIMARRFTLEGACVKAVIEILPYVEGDKKLIKECLEDFNIPLIFSHTVIDVQGKERIKGITIARAENNAVITDTEQEISCDTIVLSVELSPESELAFKSGIDTVPFTKGIKVNKNMETNVSGIFSCGNVVFIHDKVDNITYEGYRAGENAVNYIKK